MNKKSKLISIFFLASLLFISTINVGKAAPPSWVGVNAGDSFTWTITVNRDTAITLATDLGYSTFISPDITDLVGTQEEVQIRVRVLSITDLMTFNGTDYVNVSCSLSIILPDTTTIEDVSEFGNLIIKYVPNNYFVQFWNLGGIMTSSTLGALFIPTDINWAQLIAEVNLMAGMFPGFPSIGLTFTALANGTRATMAAQMIDLSGLGETSLGNITLSETQVTTLGNITLSEIQVTIIYNDDGVLDNAEITYGGDVLLDLALTAGADGGEIPSYEVTIVLTTTLVASIGIIYYIKKKKRLG